MSELMKVLEMLKSAGLVAVLPERLEEKKRERESLIKEIEELERTLKEKREKLASLETVLVAFGAIEAPPKPAAPVAVGRGEKRKVLAEFLRKQPIGTELKPKTIKESTGIYSGYLGNLLSEFVSSGVLEKTAVGTYKLVRYP
ncbi:MAG: hypothetical protein QXT64_04825 [Desulfurococcaceae archaeon]